MHYVLGVDNKRVLILMETVGYKRLVLFVRKDGRGQEVVDRSLEINEVSRERWEEVMETGKPGTL